MYEETENMVNGWMSKVTKSNRVKQAKQTMKNTGKAVKEDSMGVLWRIITSLLKAILYAPLAIVVMPIVSAFRHRKGKPSGILRNLT